MKIAFINAYQKTVSRGSETYIRELAKRLNNNHKVDILSGDIPSPSRWPVLWRFFLDPQGLYVALFSLKLIPKLWRQDYDVIIPTNSGWQPAFIRLLTWIKGSKMVIMGHSGIGWDDRNNLWSFPDRFIPISKKALKWAKRAMPLVESVYIPVGVDTKKFNPKGPRVKTGLKKPIILCIGAYEPEKRIDLVIRAVSRMKNASLLLNGRGSLEKEIKALADDLLGDRVKLSSANYEDIDEVYRSADLFTTASSPGSAFELVIVEAMASGLPVVVTDDEIRRNIVSDAGMFVDPEDTSLYANKLTEALKKDWKDIPRKRAVNFSWDMVAKKYDKLLDDLIK